MKKKYLNIILISLIISVTLNILLINNINNLKIEIGNLYNRTFFYCNFSLENLKNNINDLDKEQLNLYRGKLTELEYMTRILPFEPIVIVLRSIDTELNKALEKNSNGDNSTEEFKLVLQLIKIINDAYYMVLNECGENDLLWYKNINNNEFAENINKFVSESYDKIYK